MAETVEQEASLTRLVEYDTYGIPATAIYYDESFNCRGLFTPQSVRDLADSIRDTGLQFPVVVEPWERDGFPYRLLAGHRRYVATVRLLSWETIPASIRRNLTERQARLLNFTENLERKDLNPLEEAQALGRLFPEGVSLRVAAAELKRPTNWVHDRLRLLTLPEEVQQLAASGLLGMVHIKMLVTLPPDRQIDAARKIVEAKREHGRRASLKHLEPAYRRKFGFRKSKAEINRMVGVMLGRGIEGLGPRMGAWCAGYISDEEILKDIKDATLKVAGNFEATYGDDDSRRKTERTTRHRRSPAKGRKRPAR